MTTGIRMNGAAGKVLSQLRDRTKTIEEIAAALRLTANAVRNQLRELLRANLVVQAGKRPSGRKPSTLYAITLEGQIQRSTLYMPVLTQFVCVAESQCSGTPLESLMLDTGKSLAKRYPRLRGGLKHKADGAARLLNSFGGLAEVRRRKEAIVIRSHVCPLAALNAEMQTRAGFLRDCLQNVSLHACGFVATCRRSHSVALL